MHILLVADHRVHDAIMFPLQAFQHCKRPSSNVVVLDYMDAVAVLQLMDAVLVEHIVDTSLDDVDHVDSVDFVVDACQIAVALVAVDFAYLAMVDLAAYSYFVVAVDLVADQRTAYSVALERCSVAVLAKENRSK